MATKASPAAVVAWLVVASPVVAEQPMSAIDWLSDSVLAPPAPITAPSNLPHDKDVAKSAAVEDISVSTLDGPAPDGVGLLPASVTGLPATLWHGSESEVLQALILNQKTDALPSAQALLYRLLLAEVRPPQDASGAGDLLLARVDKLLDLGALNQAQALLERAGDENPNLFRRRFDVALLTGTENGACEVMGRNADIAPTFPARIFCLARNGDWNAAALTLETAEALGYVTPAEDALLARFLDPELFEGEGPLPPESRPTPLEFRMREAVGEPIPTTSLPRAFANADLRDTVGWSARVNAAERLARTGAIEANQLIGIYSERLPPASGGLWARVDAIQQFDIAFKTSDPNTVATVLPKTWSKMAEAGLEAPFAALYGEGLAKLPLTDAAKALAFRIGLLSPSYETIAAAHKAQTKQERFLVALALGEADALAPYDALSGVVADGFSGEPIPDAIAAKLETGRLGEVILEAIARFTSAQSGDLKEAGTALRVFRALGLEETARRAALELILLRRRG